MSPLLLPSGACPVWAARRDVGASRSGRRGDGPRVVIFGLGRFGTAIGERLRRRGEAVLGADFNPQAVRRARELGIRAAYGDASDPEFVAALPLARAEWILFAAPPHPTGLSREDDRATLIQLARAAGFTGRIAVTSHGPRDTAALAVAGADLVFEPFQDAADRAVELIGGADPEARTDIPPIGAEARPAG